MLRSSKRMLFDKPSSDFVNVARALINEFNIEKLFEKKPMFSYPMPFLGRGHTSTPGYSIWSSAMIGSYATPGFGNSSFQRRSQQNIHFILTFPLVIMNQAEDAELDIELKVENNEEAVVQYRVGERYSMYRTDHEKRSWADADRFCQEGRGSCLVEFFAIFNHKRYRKKT